MSRAVKELVVGELKGRFEGLEGAVLVDFTGLDSEMTYDLRRSLNERRVRMNVIQNRLARRAFEQIGLGAASPLLEGPTAVAWGEDSVAVAKTIFEWRKKNKTDLLAVKGGLLQGRLLGADEVEKLAAMPDRQVLLAQVVSLIASPLSGLVGALSGVLRKPLYALKAVEEKKASGAAQGQAPAE